MESVYFIRIPTFFVRPGACFALRSFSTEKRSFVKQKNHLLCGWWELLKLTVQNLQCYNNDGSPTTSKDKGGIHMDMNSLSHTKWNCKYHIVFAPKFRRKVIYGQLKRDIANILSALCKRKGVKIVEAEMCPDHVHMLVEIPPSISVSSFVGYLKGKSTLMIFERHANLKYKYGNRHFWCRGYYVDTVGKNAKKIQAYIQNQLKEDLEYDQMALKEFIDPFTGEPVKSNK